MHFFSAKRGRKKGTILEESLTNRDGTFLEENSSPLAGPSPDIKLMS